MKGKIIFRFDEETIQRNDIIQSRLSLTKKERYHYLSFFADGDNSRNDFEWPPPIVEILIKIDTNLIEPDYSKEFTFTNKQGIEIVSNFYSVAHDDLQEIELLIKPSEGEIYQIKLKSREVNIDCNLVLQSEHHLYWEELWDYLE